MLKRYQMNSRGDTIVEVMIALSLLAFALTTSYSTVTRSLQTARNAQEHSEALQFLDSQVELARADAADTTLYSSFGNFCMTPAATRVAIIDPACTTGVEGFYKMRNTYTPSTAFGITQDIFTFTVTWPGAGQLGQQYEEISYKIHKP